MGYDMLIEPAAVAHPALQGARTEFEASQERLLPFLAERNKFGASTGYYGLNIWAMTIFRGVMDELGMLTHPAPPDYGSITDEEQAYVAAHDADSRTPGIPEYKLTSNDDQLVCPREIAAALAAYDVSLEPEELVRPLLDDRPESLAMWQVWTSFLRLAAVAGGFRVY